MTVAQLIAALQALPQELPAVVYDGEGGDLGPIDKFEVDEDRVRVVVAYWPV